jgi:MSHA biogenesis protein MshK
MKQVRDTRYEIRVDGGAARGFDPHLVSRIPYRACLALCLALLAPGAAAQVMTDPMRPPPGFDVGAADAGDRGGGIMLQSVLISPTRRAAIINGVLVRLGERYGDAVLIAVAESEVVLRSGGTRQVLKLHPAVDKRERGAATAGTERGGNARSGGALGEQP